MLRQLQTIRRPSTTRGERAVMLQAPALWIAVAWSGIALAAALQTALLVRLDGGATLAHALASRLSIIPLWALATPLVLRSARRFPVAAHGHPLSPAYLALHLALGSLFIVASNVAIRLPMLFDAGALELSRSALRGVAEFYPGAIVVYLALVALGHVRRATGASTAASASEASSEPVAPDAPPVYAAVVRGEEPPHVDRLAVRQWDRVHFVRLDDIDWIDAEDNYVVVHAAGRRYRTRERIGDLESRLDARRFVRIHRSTIVHVERIREVQSLTHGDHAAILRDGTVLRVARSRRAALAAATGRGLPRMRVPQPSAASIGVLDER
jgi:two-component system LytT family response regulator